jgi:hypothetical protein
MHCRLDRKLNEQQVRVVSLLAASGLPAAVMAGESLFPKGCGLSGECSGLLGLYALGVIVPSVVTGPGLLTVCIVGIPKTLRHFVWWWLVFAALVPVWIYAFLDPAILRL